MYLRATDKATGVRNFHSALGNKLVARDLAAKALKQKLSSRDAKPVDRLVVAVLGVGQQGRRLLAAVNKDLIEVRSIADPRPSCRELALDSLLRVYGGKKWKKAEKASNDALEEYDIVPVDTAAGHAEDKKHSLAVYGSYDALLKAAQADLAARKPGAIQAVIIALPSHLHAAAAKAALDANLHVFIEPPMALTVAEAKEIAAKAAKKSRCLAVGQQRRHSVIYDYALKMIEKDLLDQIHYARSQWHLLKPEKKADEEKPDMTAEEAEAAKKKAAEEAKKYKLDWWQDVPAKDLAGLKAAGYEHPEEAARWQLYEKSSGGLLTELGSQLFDAAAMFMAATPNRDPGRPYPLSVAGSSSQALPNVGGDIDDHVHCIFEYAIQGYVDLPEVPLKARRKIALQFDVIIGNEFDGYGEIVLGRNGSLILENEKRPMLFHTSDVDKTIRVTQKKDPETKEPLTDAGGAPVPWIDTPKDGKADEDSEAFGHMALQGGDGSFAAELEDWASCCHEPAGGKGKKKPRCDAEKGLYTTVLTVAAKKAVELGKRIEFKDAWFDVGKKETPDDLK